MRKVNHRVASAKKRVANRLSRLASKVAKGPITQVILAKKLDVTQATVSRWLRSDIECPAWAIDAMEKLANMASSRRSKSLPRC